jgi:RND family efflux transporter MFP subunit
METKNKSKSGWRVLCLTLLTSIGLLGTGFFGMQTLTDMKTPPVKKEIEENALKVEIKKAEYDSITPFITGFGEVTSVEIVPLSAEVQGKVIEIHPQLEVGELIRKGELIAKIDTSEERLSLESNTKRLTALRRNLELAQKEFQRMQKLYKIDQLVSVSYLEKAEQAYQSLKDGISTLEYAVHASQLKIKKATLKAPFHGRIKSVSVEKNQYVSPGVPLVTIVNDSILEIHVSIDSEQAKKIIQFKKPTRLHKQFWFFELEKVDVLVSWNQGSSKIEQNGVLDRVVGFDSKTRTLNLAVRLTEGESKPLSGFPIVEGMFCQVKIPGKKIDNIIKLPRQAVQYNKSVYMVVDNRLKTVPIKVNWIENEFVYVSEGIIEDDQIILTRLSDPLENTLIEVSQPAFIAENTNISETAGRINQ